MNHPIGQTFVLMPLPRRLEEHADFVPTGDGEKLPLFIGGGGDDLLCGECSFLLAQSVTLDQFRDRKLFCPQCARENVIPRVGELSALGEVPYVAPPIAVERPSVVPSPDRSVTGRADIGESPAVDA